MPISRKLTALALLLAAPAVAHAKGPAAPVTVTRDGKTFTYTTVTKRNVTIIEGTDGIDQFTLYVRDGRVSGHYGYDNVNFVVPDRAAADKELAAR